MFEEALGSVMFANAQVLRTTLDISTAHFHLRDGLAAWLPIR